MKILNEIRRGKMVAKFTQVVIKVKGNKITPSVIGIS